MDIRNTALSQIKRWLGINGDQDTSSSLDIISRSQGREQHRLLNKFSCSTLKAALNACNLLGSLQTPHKAVSTWCFPSLSINVPSVETWAQTGIWHIVEMPLGMFGLHTGAPGLSHQLIAAPSFLIAHTLGGNGWWFKNLCPYHSCGRLRLDFLLLPLIWVLAGICKVSLCSPTNGRKEAEKKGKER